MNTMIITSIGVVNYNMIPTTMLIYFRMIIGFNIKYIFNIMAVSECESVSIKRMNIKKILKLL